jgi:hypothetical protein
MAGRRIKEPDLDQSDIGHPSLPRLSEQAWRRTAMSAADMIARGLQRDRQPVF